MAFLPPRSDRRRQFGPALRAARIDGDGDAPGFVAFDPADERRQQGGGKVVDAIVASVFEDVQGDGFTGARDTVNE
jgi:hypothetical protein